MTAGAPSGSIDYFNRRHRLHAIKARIALSARRRMYERLLRHLPLDPERSVLDVGTTPDLELPYNNFFERWYPYPGRVTACSVEDCSNLEAAFPGLSFVKVSDDRLPFRDRQFDAALSFAVLEHVGAREAQRQHLAELARVASTFVAYTPYRFCPVEFHTLLPLTHWLPAGVHRPLWRAMGMAFWADERNLNLVGLRDIRAMLPRGGAASVRVLWTLGCPANLEIVWRRA